MSEKDGKVAESPKMFGNTTGDWKSLQESVYRNWLNTQIAKIPEQEKELISKDSKNKNLLQLIADGLTIPFVLAYALLPEKSAQMKINRNAAALSNRLNRVNNLNAALQYLKNYGEVNLVNIGAEDLADANYVACMALIWALISKFQGINSADRDTLLKKINDILQTTDIPNLPPIKNFSSSTWKDGRVLVALIAALTNQGQGKLPFAQITQDPIRYLETAFQVADSELNAPPILPIELFTVSAGAGLEEKAILTYISFFKLLDVDSEKIKSKPLPPPKSPSPEFHRPPIPAVSNLNLDKLSNLDTMFRRNIAPELLDLVGFQPPPMINQYSSEGNTQKRIDEIVAQIETYMNSIVARFQQYRSQAAESQSGFNEAQIAMKQQMASAISESQRLTAEFNRLQGQLAQTTTITDSLRSEISRLNFTVQTSEQQLKAAQGRIAELSALGDPNATPLSGEGDGAPEGNIAIVFTDVQSSTVQWGINAEAMAAAITTHNNHFRELIKEFGAYEVKTVGDAFMIAFHSATSAVDLCTKAQNTLLHLNWPQAIYSNKDSMRETATKISTKEEIVIWNGLRIRMGIHFGKPTALRDPVTKRMDYFGPFVNQSARVESVAAGGQVVASSQVLNQYLIENNLASENEVNNTNNPTAPFNEKQKPVIEQKLNNLVKLRELGNYRLKGLDFDLNLWELNPENLQLRNLPVPENGNAAKHGEGGIKSNEDRMKDLQQTERQLRQELDQMSREVEKEKQRAESLVSVLENMKDNLENSSELDNISAVQEKLVGLMSSNQQFESKSKEYATTIAKLEKNILEIEKVKELMGKELKDIGEENGVLKTSSQTLQERQTDLEKQLEGVEKRRSELEDKIKVLEAQQGGLGKKKEDWEQLKRGIRDKLMLEQKKRDELNRELDRVKKELEGMKKEVGREAVKRVREQERVKEAERKMGKLEMERDDLERQCTELVAKLEESLKKYAMLVHENRKNENNSDNNSYSGSTRKPYSPNMKRASLVIRGTKEY